MTKKAKILIGVGIGVVVIGGALITALVVGMNYLESRFNESVKPAEAEGLAFGKSTDQNGCIDEALVRSKPNKILDLGAGIATGVFVDSCLKTCKPSQGFCDGVPSFWDTKDSEWKVDQCKKRGLDIQNTGCMHVFQAKFQHCSR